MKTMNWVLGIAVLALVAAPAFAGFSRSASRARRCTAAGSICRRLKARGAWDW